MGSHVILASAGHSLCCILHSFQAVIKKILNAKSKIQKINSSRTCIYHTVSGGPHLPVLSAPFVGMTTTLIGLFQVGSPATYASRCLLYS